MLDISTEPPVSLEDIATHCQKHFSTVYRWALKGVPAPDGNRVRLEALRVGGRWVSTWNALQRFAEATTPQLDNDPMRLPRSPGTHSRHLERVAAGLDAADI